MDSKTWESPAVRRTTRWPSDSSSLHLVLKYKEKERTKAASEEQLSLRRYVSDVPSFFLVYVFDV